MDELSLIFGIIIQCCISIVPPCSSSCSCCSNFFNKQLFIFNISYFGLGLIFLCAVLPFVTLPAVIASLVIAVLVGWVIGNIIVLKYFTKIDVEKFDCRICFSSCSCSKEASDTPVISFNYISEDSQPSPNFPYVGPAHHQSSCVIVTEIKKDDPPSYLPPPSYDDITSNK